jgi:hypothetical protein
MKRLPCHHRVTGKQSVNRYRSGIVVETTESGVGEYCKPGKHVQRNLGQICRNLGRLGSLAALWQVQSASWVTLSTIFWGVAGSSDPTSALSWRAVGVLVPLPKSRGFGADCFRLKSVDFSDLND